MDSTTTAKQSCYNTLVYWSEILKHLNDDDHDDDNSIRNTIGSIVSKFLLMMIGYNRFFITILFF